MKDLSPILKSLGLNDSEIKTYMAAFTNGAGTAIDLAKQAKISRGAVYLAIEELTKRGLMSSVLHGKKRLYTAEHPVNLIDYAKRKQQELNEHLHDLQTMLPEMELEMGGQKPVVKVFQGKEGIRAIIDEMKASGRSEYMEMTDLEAMYKILSPDDLKPLREVLIKYETASKAIYLGAVKSQGRRSSKRYALPVDTPPFRSHVTIYTDKVIFVTYEGKMTSVVIESKEIAQLLKTLFNVALESQKSLRPID